MVDIRYTEFNFEPTPHLVYLEDVLLDGFSLFPLVGQGHAFDATSEAIGIPIPDGTTELEIIEAALSFYLSFGPTYDNYIYADRFVTAEEDVFDINLFQLRGSAKVGFTNNYALIESNVRLEGSGFVFGDDPLGNPAPIDGTIERIILTNHVLGARSELTDVENPKGYGLDLEIDISGLELDVTSTLFDDEDELLALILEGDNRFEISPYLQPSFFGDGRNVASGTRTGGDDFIELTVIGYKEVVDQPEWAFGGDYLRVMAGATVTGGDDTIVGIYPVTENPVAEQSVSGDAQFVDGHLNGGDDIVNFTASTLGGAAIYGDAFSASGTVIGGNDELVGTNFDDVIVGDVGTAESGATVEGGNDELFGLDGDDHLIGDVATTESGATVTGGNDRIFGGEGDDRLEGGDGNDDLDGGADLDILIAGAGDDFLIVNEAADVEAGEIYFGGAGRDHFILFGGGTVDLRDVDIIGMEGVRFGGETGGGFRINSSQISRGVFDPDALVRVFAPDGQTEQFIVDIDDGEADLGDLVFRGWERRTDQVIINGSSEDDILTGSTRNDLISGGRGGDTLDGGIGRDTLEGGLGNDVYHVGLRDTVVEDAGQGFDQIISSRNFRGSMANIEQVTLADVGRARVIRGDDGDNHLVGNSFDNRLFGRGGDDVLDGIGGSNLLNGGDGDDTLNGGNGEDTLVGGSGDDLIEGGGADDVILGGGGADIAVGGSGDDRINAGAGDDSLNGGAGDDSLNGGNGSDRLFGGDGSDTLTGGFGADSFALEIPGNGDVDVITDFRRADTILLVGRDFGLAHGILDDDAFAFSPGALQTADTRVIYEGDTGRLLFDSDGTGIDDAVLLAQLEVGLSIDADDFLVII